MTHDEISTAYRAYGHLVLRRCKRILRRDNAAEDALQEVFLRLWRYGDAFGAAESKLGWLYRVADRCCFDILARERKRAESELDPSDEAHAGRGVSSIEDREIVLRFLQRFDDDLKQIAILHYMDELTQEEIASATGWSRQTIVKKLAYLAERAARLRSVLLESKARSS
jgi:RNA polymerase sigma-70 factor (ECF subfamily)